MNKYTIIIPTLWKSNRIHNLLKDLINCEYVNEIILIDNSNEYYNHYSTILNKINLIQPKSNLYIAGSWNLGVKLAHNNYISICNDDINFNPNIFEKIKDIQGIIGMSKDNFNIDGLENPIISKMTLDMYRPTGWATFLIFKKYDWTPIPENLKIWYNDDWLIVANPIDKYILSNFSIYTEMSTTIGHGKFEDIKLQDKKIFREILKDCNPIHFFKYPDLNLQ